MQTNTEHIPVYTISALNKAVSMILGEALSPLWVEGEISNFKQHSSGHLYFSLKDASSEISCTLFRAQRAHLRFFPKDGTQVLAYGKVGLYEARGKYQIIIEHMEPSGDGKLKAQFEALKQSLNQEGLFATEHKKTLPKHPRTIGVITSATGAAIQDILSVLRRRAPHLSVIIYPTSVQGQTAAASIVRTIEVANQRNECDLLILARGGGSLEDLWCFNEECVARAIFASQKPIVSGVGHEVDVTIADFVADQRAATPSAAAERVCTDQQHYLDQMNFYTRRIKQAIETKLIACQTLIQQTAKRLHHPGRRLEQQMQQLDDMNTRLQRAIKNRYASCQQRIQSIERTLMAISPLNTLQRGYSIVRKGHHIVRNTKELPIGAAISVQLTDGTVYAQVVDD